MPYWKIPIPQQIDDAIALFGQIQHYRYFFEQLKNPEWIKPLKERGYFSNPPKPQLDEARGTISFFVWPESRYLARMASYAPKIVLETILETPDTDNMRVYEDFVDAALAMPPELAVSLSEKAKIWASTRHQWSLLPEKLGLLIAHLAKGGHVDAALDLTRIMFDILPDLTAENKGEKENIYSFPKEPRARFDAWNYEQIMTKNLPPVIKVAGLKALTLLCDLLQKAIKLSQREDEEYRDYSYVWRPAVEEHTQNHKHGFKDILVSIIRDATEQLVSDNISSVSEITEVLERQRWPIFPRIALHVLKRFPERAQNLVVKRLTNHDLFEDIDVRHEYVLLLGECFNLLPKEQQEIVFGWIEKGPDVQKFKEFMKQRKGEDPTEEEIAIYKNTWQRDRLHYLRNSLSGHWKEIYEDLVKRYKEPGHPEFPSYSIGGGFAGPTSPKNTEELQALPVKSIIEFLQSWEPSDDFMAPSKEGLGRVLSSIIAKNPTRFASDASTFKDVDPTYVRSLIWGFRDAINNKIVFDWDSLIDLCLWIVHQPREIDGRLKTMHSDFDWGGTRDAITDLLSAGFEQGIGCIPFKHREEIWDIIYPLTKDPEPTPDYESRYGGSNQDLSTMSINTTRGKAMHTVLRYALWVRRALEDASDAALKLSRGFDEMPEVREVLNDHLDVVHDPSLAIRSIYGQWFPWFVLLDPKWARSQVSLIFPYNKSEIDHYNAAWDTYVIFCTPYDNVLDVLTEQYERAADSIDVSTKKKHLIGDTNEHLAQHLMTYYWRGKLDNEPKSIVSLFFEKTSEELRGQAIGFVGHSLYNTKDEVPSEILMRLKTLWERRLEIAQKASKGSGYEAEMVAFGWWFVSRKFDDKWSIAQLIEALKISKQVKPDHLVAERLAALVQTMPKETVICLNSIVKGDRDGWGIYAWRDSAKSILSTALHAADIDAIEVAKDTIHYLGSRGYYEFGNLLISSF
jgi:hypothetical protein